MQEERRGHRPCKGQARLKAGERRQIHDVDAVGDAVLRHHGNLRAGRRRQLYAPAVRRRARTGLQGIPALDAGESARGGQDHDARVVRDLQVQALTGTRHRRQGRQRGIVGGCRTHGRARRGQQQRATRRTQAIRDLAQLLLHESAQQLRILQDLAQRRDLRQQLVALGLQLDARELREATQAQLEDVVGLGLGQVEGRHEALARDLRIIGGANDGDNVVDVQDRDEQALDQVQAILALLQAEAAAARRDVQAVIQEDLQHFLQAQRARLAAHERHGVDREGILQRRALVELLEHGLGVETVLYFDDQAQAVDTVGEVLNRGNALEASRVRVLLDLFDDLFRAHHVGQLRDDDAHLAGGHALDLDLRACLERASAGFVGFLDALEADDDAALGQVRAGDVAHEVCDRCRRVIQQVDSASDRLRQVVWGDIRRHAHGDARGAVDQQLGEGRRQDVRLHELVVVVGDEIDRVLIQARHQVQRGGRHARLGVTRGGRAVVQRAEVTVSIDQRNTQVKGLREAHQGLVNRGIAVRVELTHDLADDALGLHVSLVGAQPHLIHLEQDAALHGLEAIARVGERASVDHRDGILQEGPTHLIGHVDLCDVLVLLRDVDDLVLLSHTRNYCAAWRSFRLARRFGAQLGHGHMDSYRTWGLLPQGRAACAAPRSGRCGAARDAVPGGYGFRPRIGLPAPHGRLADGPRHRSAARR